MAELFSQIQIKIACNHCLMSKVPLVHPIVLFVTKSLLASKSNILLYEKITPGARYVGEGGLDSPDKEERTFCHLSLTGGMKVVRSRSPVNWSSRFM